MIIDEYEKLAHEQNNLYEKATELLKTKPERLFKDIFYYLKRQGFGPDIDIREALPFVSALLINLSRDAEKQTKRIIHLTYWLLAITAILLTFEIYQYANSNIKRNGNQTELNKEINSMKPISTETPKTEQKQYDKK